MTDIDGSLLPTSRPRGQGHPVTSRALAAAVCALAILGSVRDSAAQSPFTRTPSRSGAFTIPEPGERRPGPGATPGQTMPRPAPPRMAPLAPLPVEEAPARRGAIPPVAAPSELPLPLPSTLETLPIQPRTLPPKPEVAPRLNASPTAPGPPAPPILLRSGLTVTLRICQVLPADGLTAGERLLNSRPAIQPGDGFLAEVIEPCPPYPILVGGTVTEITRPGHFGRPGYVSIQMAQLVQSVEGQAGLLPWRMDLADRRFVAVMRRALLTTLLGLEGAGTGASIGAQFHTANMAFIGAGMGIGALVGFGYASFMRGTEANLEPGDTFEITVGTTQYRPVPRDWQTILYPAADAGKGHKK